MISLERMCITHIWVISNKDSLVKVIGQTVPSQGQQCVWWRWWWWWKAMAPTVKYFPSIHPSIHSSFIHSVCSLSKLWNGNFHSMHLNWKKNCENRHWVLVCVCVEIVWERERCVCVFGCLALKNFRSFLLYWNTFQSGLLHRCFGYRWAKLFPFHRCSICI